MMKREEQRKGASPRQPKPVKAAGAPAKQRTSPRQFIGEVGTELGKVAWPTREEVVAYSLVVLVAVVVIAALIAAMDFVFAKAVLALFGIET